MLVRAETELFMPPHPFAGLQPAHYCEQQSIRLRTHASQTNFTRVSSATAMVPTSIYLRASSGRIGIVGATRLTCFGEVNHDVAETPC